MTANYGSSSQLRTQLQEGAKADIFASADVAQMEQVAKAGLVDGNATIFARNRLVVIVPKGNPGKVTTLADLAKPGVKFVTTPPDVPIGAYARASLKKLASDPANGNGYDAKVLANIVSEEANVRQVVVKVQLGEADAGICYATDVTAVPSGEVTTIDIPDSANVVAEYPIAILKSAKAPAAQAPHILHQFSLRPVHPRRREVQASVISTVSWRIIRTTARCQSHRDRQRRP